MSERKKYVKPKITVVKTIHKVNLLGCSKGENCVVYED